MAQVLLLLLLKSCVNWQLKLSSVRTMALVEALALFCLVATSAWGAPVTYDQRQEGEWNVHAHLDNFVIILIPSSNAAGLLDPSKLNPLKSQLRHVFKAATQAQVAESTQPRIADSSTKTNESPLSKLHPSEPAMMAESPSVSLHETPKQELPIKKEEIPSVPVISASALKEDKQSQVESRAKSLPMTVPCPQGECPPINRRSQRLLSVLSESSL